MVGQADDLPRLRRASVGRKGTEPGLEARLRQFFAVVLKRRSP